jgi:hypothetical protein
VIPVEEAHSGTCEKMTAGIPESTTRMQGNILLEQDVVRDLVVRMIQAVVDSPEAVTVDAATE